MKQFATMLLLLAASTASLAQPSAPEVVLIRAHMLKVTPIPNTGHAPEPGKVFFGADARVTVAPPEFLIGRERPVSTLVMRMSAIPIVDKAGDIFVLARVSGQDEFKVLGWSYVSQGVCVDAELARKLGIEQQLAELHRSGKAVCAP